MLKPINEDKKLKLKFTKADVIKFRRKKFADSWINIENKYKTNNSIFIKSQTENNNSSFRNEIGDKINLISTTVNIEEDKKINIKSKKDLDKN